MHCQTSVDQFSGAPHVVEGVTGDRNVENGRLASAPDNPGMDVVGERALDDDFVDGTALERLLLCPAEIGPSDR